MRLLCFSDAGEMAGGCTIYCGYRYPEGHFSSRLVYTKSRLMRSTVPRNELESILICAEASLLVQKALGDMVKEVVYFSNSTIALSWILNGRKLLRMWVHNRVTEILTAIKWVVGGTDTYPIYHISSEDNLADMVTKPRQLYQSDMGRDSVWQTYLEWMQLPTDQMPIRQITVPEEPEEKQAFESELFPDVGPIDEEEYRVMLLGHEGYYPDAPVHREHAFPFLWDYPQGSDSEEDDNEGLNAEAYQEKRVQSRTDIRRRVPSERGRRQGDGFHTPTFITRTTVVDQR